MKRIDELAYDELIVLSQEEIDRFIEIEIAHAGIQPIDAPEPPTYADLTIEPTHAVFRVESVLLGKREDAEAFVAMERFDEEYDWQRGDSKYKHLSVAADASIEQKSYYKKHDIDALAVPIAENKRLKNAYSKAQGEHQKFVKATANCRAHVHDRVDAAMKLKAKLDRTRKTYERYLELADGDVKIAEQFLRGTYKEYQELVDATLGDDLKLAKLLNDLDICADGEGSEDE